MFSFANLQTNLPRTEGPWTPSLILSRLHHMTLNLCINEPLYALERSGERCALSNHIGSSPRAAFYLLSTFLACKQKLIHSQFLVIFTHCYAKKNNKSNLYNIIQGAFKNSKSRWLPPCAQPYLHVIYFNVEALGDERVHVGGILKGQKSQKKGCQKKMKASQTGALNNKQTFIVFSGLEMVYVTLSDDLVVNDEGFYFQCAQPQWQSSILKLWQDLFFFIGHNKIEQHRKQSIGLRSQSHLYWRKQRNKRFY